jgi:calcineurin-like phosphoesterase
LDKLKNYSLNIIIVLAAVTAVYLAYSFIRHTTSSSSSNDIKSKIDTLTNRVTKQPTGKILQIDVQNGTKTKGIAEKVTDYLRKNGFDVVEMGNYSNQDIQKTLVIDRAGNIKNAKLLAASLGVSEKNVIQQMNKNYFLDATIVIGKDYQELNPFKTR